jgi:WD40 repeat protein/tetratricopeptide (TPR) repeat protein
VHSVAWNPQASQLATASFDGTITIWDGETGAEIRSLVGHAGSVHSAVWSPDGKQIVSAGADRNLMIWDAATGRKMRTLAGHDDEVLSAAWSPDGRWIASGGRGGVVKAWDAATGMSRRSLRSEGYEVRCVAWSPDSTRLASAGGDGQNCRIWDVESGQQIHQLLGHLYEINSVDWSPDGTQLVTACRDKAIRIWDAASGQQTTMVHGHTGGVSAARWSPNGKEIASSSQDQTVKLWNVKAGAEKLTFRGHTGAVFGVGWSPDGRKIATASEDHLVKVWDAATGRLLQNFIGHTAGVLAVAWSPDGTCLASAGDDRVIVVWNSTTGEQMSSLRGNTAQVESVAWSPDSSQLAATGHDQTLRVWNAATGETVRGLSFASRARTVAWSPDGRRLALTLESECARVFDTTTWTELVQLSDHVLGLAWSPDGTRLATSHPQGVVKIWNSQTGAELFALRGHATWSNSVAWSPDGRRLASTSEDCTTKIWDTSDGSLALTLPGSGNWFFSAAWSPDGRSLAATSYDHTLRVWRTERAYERDRSPFILPALNRRLAVDPADIHTLCARADVYQKLARPDDAKTDRAAARRMAEQRLREQPDDEAMAFELVDMFRDEIERNCSERWQILTPVEVKSAGGATLTILADGSVLAGGMNPVHELYTVGLESNQANIVALRLETLPHPSLPFGGSGRALINGNFHLAELTVSREPRHGISEKTAVAIASAFSDIAGDGGRSIRLALDGDPGTQWTPFPDQSTWHQACLQFAHSVDGRSARLVIAVDSGTDHKTAQAIGRFRISVTSDPDAVLMERLRHVSATHWASARCRLGAALFLVGDFAAAAEQLERIVLHRGRGEGLELMLLALAHHRLDHGPEANRWHAAAIEWGARNSADESLTEFAVECTQRIRGNTRAEFIRLLGEQKLHHAAFYQWRANLSAEAGDSESAAADYNQAIDRLPLDVRSALPRSTLVGAVIRTPPPVFEALLKLRQDAPRLLLFRGRVKAMQKDWKQAAEDYTRAAASRPAGEECFEHAGVLLLAGDVEGYCAFAQGLAQQHGETKDPVMAFILARTAALGLESPVESCRMIAWGEQAVAGEKYPWYLHALGLALYRAHRYDEAAARLEQSLAGEWNTEGALLNHLALSLTNLRQDRPDESQQHVEKARDLAASIESDAGVSDSIIVHDWLEYHILLRELEATIQRNSVP